MKWKQKFQECLVKYGGTWVFKYVEKNRLMDDVVNFLILQERDDILLHYIKFHTLSTNQITAILNRLEVGELMLEVVKRNSLTEEQQKILVEKNNVLLLEAYLSPNGFWDENRRFKSLPEYLFIYNILNSEKMTGSELFKMYVDNCYRSLLSNDLLILFTNFPEAFATKYILKRAKLKKEWEKGFIENSPEELLRYYISEHEFNTETAQILLIRTNFALAKEYNEKYRFRGNPQQIYHDIRQAEIERKKAEI